LVGAVVEDEEPLAEDGHRSDPPMRAVGVAAVTTPPILSVSQAEKFDPEQTGGCPRRWWFEDVRGLRPDSTAAHEDGHQGHRLLAGYLMTGERPGRVRLGKAINAVIDSGALPTPGPHLQVERRFSGQPHRDASGAWVALDVSRTLWHGGHPWEGFIDLRFRHRDGTATVWDHKFSSDIHERALPAEKLIRTVQMPVYALDTLREWPDTRAFNLVLLYVSRRGVESFIRHQRVSVEQVRERAKELIPLVQQMDAARAVTAQDDVPFNRAACHARMGCPHQFRCNAFRRKQMMELSEEEMAMFGMVSDKKPEGAPTPARVAEPFERPAAGRVATPADLNLDDIFEDMPKPSAPKAQPAPTCEACGEVLTPENSSRLKTGDMKHLGCTKGGITLAGGGAITVDPRPAAVQPVETRTCPNCPHRMHEGRPCEGKRGRGACRCGERVPVGGVVAPLATPAPQVHADGAEPAGKPKQSAAELQALAEEAARAADVDGDGAAVEEARQLHEAAEQAKQEEYAVELARTRGASLSSAQQRVTELEAQLQTMREIAEDPELAPRGSWSGTLAVNVTVELGPSTLAFLVGLVKR
jgi:hypothetical protein